MPNRSHSKIKRASLNHTYRLVWSDAKQMYIAVAEITSGKGKRKGGIVGVVAALMMGFGGIAHALDPGTLPTGANVTHGQAQIDQNANVMNIHQTTDKLITHWSSFNIGQDATVNFHQPNSNSAALNRMVENNPSQILGNLNANGNVYLVNPSGIFFGKEAQINVGGLIASTLDIADQDFINGNLNFKNLGFSDGDIQNLGHIRANGGVVALIANRVSNQGTIEANNGNVALAAGDIVTLDFTGDGLMTVKVEQGVLDALAENGGLIQADGGFVIMTTQAQNDIYKSVVNNDGLIQARTLQADKTGRIMLMGGMSQGEVIASGTLDASAPETGDGGFIETSAANVQIQPGLQVTTLAGNGQTGEWLIDPIDITVAASGGNVTGADLAAALQTTNVTLDTEGAACTGIDCGSPSNGNGDIFIQDDIKVVDGTQDTTLTLRANRHIDFADGIEISRTGAHKLDLDFQADIDNDNTGNIVLNGATTLDANGGEISFNRAVTIASGATRTSLSIDAGALSLRDDITVQGDLLVRAPITLEENSNVTITSTNGSVAFYDTIDGHADLTLDIQNTMDVEKGMAVINAKIGDTSPLKSFTTQGDGTIFINADITTSGAQTYNNDLFIGSLAISQFINNNFESSTVNQGVTNAVDSNGITNDNNAKVSAFNRSDIDPKNVYENVIEGWTLYLNRVVSGEEFQTSILGAEMPKIDRSDLRFYVPEGSNKNYTVNQGDVVRTPTAISSVTGNTIQADRVQITSTNGTSTFIPDAYIKVVEDGSNQRNTKSLELSVDDLLLAGNATTGYGIVRGPFVVSESTAALSAGDSVSFNWKAAGALDDFAVYAYLVDRETGHTVELLNAIGGQTDQITQATIDGYNSLTGAASGTGDWSIEGNNPGWITSSVTLSETDPTGNYHFVFVSGSWDANGGRGLGASMNIDNVQTSRDVAAQALFNTVDPLPGVVTLTSNESVDFAPDNVTLQKDLVVDVRDAQIEANLSGPGSIKLVNSNAIISGANSHAATIITGGQTTLQYDEVPIAPPIFGGTGELKIQPKGEDFTAPVDLTNWDFGTGLNGITIGQTSTADGTGDQNIILGDMSAAGPISVFGDDVAINGDLASAGTITLNSSGTVTDGVDGSITASELLLQGGAVTLDSLNNNVDTLAAADISSLTFVNKDELTIGAINVTQGIDATGAISVSTLTGDLNVNENITTTDDTADAIVLNAGKDAAAGSAAGGDVKLANGVDLTSAPNGQILLYTGSVADSTGVAELVGAGSGNFRYNSDETDTNFVTPLDPTSKNAIYREQPTVNLDLTTQTITYGDTIPAEPAGLLNGDTAFEISDPLFSSSGFLQANPTGYAVSSNLADLGYNVTGATSGVLIVDPLSLDVNGAAAVTKVYDGTTTANVNGGNVTALTSDQVILSGANANFASANAGENIAVVTNYTISGDDAGNYTLVQPSLTATITPAPLTVTANNDAKFVTQADTAGFAGVSFAGFVNGETASVLGGDLTISRLNSDTDTTARSYTDVLEASGLTSTNYDITFVNGDFTIVPSDQLLVRVANVSDTYGTDTAYNVSSASYWNGSAEVALDAPTANGNNNFTFSDGAGGSATFTLIPLSATPLSTAGFVKVGAYQVGTNDPVTNNGGNFKDNIVIVGSHQVNTKAISPSVAGGVSKVYDGTTDMSGVTLGLSGTEASDKVTVDGTGAFSQSNVGTGLGYTISNLALSGDDAANYHLAGGDSFTGNNGEITQRDILLDFTGIDKVYDGSTAASVNVSDNRVAGDTLTFTKDAVFVDKNVGTNKTINVSNITLGGADSGNYNLVSTTDTTTANITRLNSVTWDGGNTGNWFDPANWAGGAVPDLSNVANVVIPENVTVTFNNTATGSATSANDAANAVNIESLGTLGSLQHDEGFLNVGNGGILLDTYTQSGGTLTNSGTTTVDSYEQTGGSFTGAGDFTTESFTQTGGETDLAANFTVNEDFSQTSNGTVSVGGNTDITDNSGGMSVGNFNTTGTTSLTSTDGDITQAAGTTFVSGGDATLTATNGDIVLDDEDNVFVGKVTANGDNIEIAATGNLDANVTADGDAILNASGDLTADVIAEGNANLTAGSNVTAELDVEGDSTLTSGDNMTVSGSADDLNINSGGTTTFGETAVAGDLNLTSAENITQTGKVDITGTADITSTNGDIALDDENNEFGDTVTANGDNITLAATGDLDANVDADGNATLNASGDLTADVIAEGNANLASGNDMTADVKAGGNAVLDAGGIMSAALDVAGNSTLTSGDNLTVSGNTTDLTMASGGTTTFGETAVAGDLNLTSAENITQTGKVDITGTADITSTNGDITLDDESNVFGVAVTASGDEVSITATGNLDADVTAEGNATLNATGDMTADVEAGGDANLTAGGDLTANLDVDGDSTLTSGGNMTVSGSADDLNIASGGTTNLGQTTLTSDLDLTSYGDITQTGKLDIAGTADITSTTGDIALDDEDNVFAGKATADGDNITLAATGDLGADVTADGNVTLNATGDLTADVEADGNTVLGAGGDMIALLDVEGDSTLTSGGNMTVSGNSTDLTISSGGTTSLSETTLTGNLDLTSDGHITQTGKLDIAGTADITSTNGDITLDNAANNFDGQVSATGNTVNIADQGNDTGAGNDTGTGNDAGASNSSKPIEDNEKANNTALGQTPSDVTSNAANTNVDQIIVDNRAPSFNFDLNNAQFNTTDNSRSLSLDGPEAETLTAGLPIFLSTGTDVNLFAVVEVQDRGSSISASPSSAEATTIATPNLTNLVVTQQGDINVREVTGVDDNLRIKITDDGVLLIEVPRSLAASEDEDITLIGVVAARRMGVTVDKLRSIIVLRD